MGQAESVPAEAQPLAQDEEAEQRPSALVIVGPSGVGKGTLIEKLMKGRSEFGFSCSHTTRAPREGEQDGVHYHYTTKEEFEKGIAEGKFLEYAYVHNNIYGTSLEAVEAVAASGKCCVLDIDVQGARQVRKSGLRAIFAFIAPPSLEELERRLRGRGTEGAEQVATRLKNAHAEMASLQEPGLYDVVITNDDVEVALGQLQQVAARALAGEIGAPPGLPAPPAAAAAGGAAAAPGGSSKAGTPAGTTPTAAAAGAAAGGSEVRPREPTFKGWLAAGPQAAAAGKQGQQAQQASAAAAAAPPNELQRWRGKVVIVTGAASGVGWALSLELAAAGVRVVAVSRRKSSLEALQAAAVEAGVPIAEFLPVVCDVTKEAEVVALPRIIAKRWPGSGVEGVVNSAAVVRGGASLLDGSTASWVEMVSTNMLGMAMVTREAVQDMVRRGVFGHIINMCCMEGHAVGEAGVGNAFYAATKHAVRAMTEGLRQEARVKGLPLRVTLVSPGPVDTPFQLGRNFGGSPKVEPLAEAGAQLAVEDVVRTVVWCLAAPPHMEVNDVVVRALPLEQQ